ncbi:MAG: hypothetical protein ACK4KW_12915 [Gemmobacter sp.]
MYGLGWFVRMARWVRNPPSRDRVVLVVGVVAACFALAAVELIWGWPDWLTTAGGARSVRP